MITRFDNAMDEVGLEFLCSNISRDTDKRWKEMRRMQIPLRASEEEEAQAASSAVVFAIERVVGAASSCALTSDAQCTTRRRAHPP